MSFVNSANDEHFYAGVNCWGKEGRVVTDVEKGTMLIVIKFKNHLP